MAPSPAAPRGRRNPPPPHPEAVERATSPATAPWLPQPAAFARKFVPASAAATDAPAVECATVPWLPPPAEFSRKLNPAAATDVPAAERLTGPTVAAPWLPPPAAFARRLGPAPSHPTPSEPQVRPPSSSRGPEALARGWAALPQDALAAVLRKLDHVEILMGPGQVCRSWRRAARDDPALWRRIDMRGHADLHRRVDLCRMAKDAIRRAKGKCEAFWAEYAADNDVLRLLGKQAPSLKSLCLISCQDIIRFEEEIKKFPLLEELEISLFTNICGKHVFQAVGQACQELKHLRFNSYRFINVRNREYSDDDAMGIACMHGLRTLQLFGNSLTNEGLSAILDNCPYLESLDIRHCFNIIMDDTLKAKCARIKTLKLPYDSTDDYGFPLCSPLWSSGIEPDSDALGSFGTYSDSDECVYGDYILDSDEDEYAVYNDPFLYLNGVGVCEEKLGPEQRMFLKDMRTLLRRNHDPAAAMDAPAAECARGPARAAPWLPPPASSRKLNPAAAADLPAIEHAIGPGPTVAAPWLPPPAAFARRLGSTPPNPSPSKPLVLPHSSSSSLSPGHVAARGWVALPRDALAAILRKLDHVEILMGFGQVCRSWRRAAHGDPALWCHIDMRGHANLHRRIDLCMMAKDAIRLAKGRCEAFWAEYAADDGVLQLLGEQASSLKSLRLISCQDIIGFEEEIKKFPLLEELEISLFTNIGGKHVFQAVGQACPELKHFRFNRYNKDDDAMGIACMHGLRTLQLFGNSLTNDGLTAILDNCPYLESLDIRHCFNIIMDDTLKAKCARIKTLKLPSDSTDDYDFPVCSPLWSSGIEPDSDAFGSLGTYSDSDDCVYGDYILDSDEYDDYCDPFRYLNGVYEDELCPEDRMFLKGMRMLMRNDNDDDDF
ncbi:unnamed protein product [Urochloa humidicola]